MALLNGLLDIGLDAMAAEVVSVSMHTADPGSTGANEVTGGAYARQTPSWGSSSDGTVATDADMTFEIPAGNTVTHVGMWGDDGGTPVFRGGAPLDNSFEFSGDGQYVVTSVSMTLTAA